MLIINVPENFHFTTLEIICLKNTISLSESMYVLDTHPNSLIFVVLGFWAIKKLIELLLLLCLLTQLKEIGFLLILVLWRDLNKIYGHAKVKMCMLG